MKEYSHAEVASYFPIETTFFNFSEGVDVMPNSTVEHVSFSDGQINLRLNTGNEVRNVLSPPLRRGGGGISNVVLVGCLKHEFWSQLAHDEHHCFYPLTNVSFRVALIVKTKILSYPF